jgi:MFS transporter, FSR family, fosmidomycin resistance protein
VIEAVAAPVRTTNLRDRLLVVAFMFGHFTHHVTNTLLTPLLPLIRDSFGLSYAQSGFLVSAFSVSQGLSQAPTGVLADRVGSRVVVATGLMLTGAMCFLIGLAGDYGQLLFLLVGLGIIAGSYHAPAAALLAQLFTSDRRGSVLGMHTLGGNFSFLATPLVAGGLTAMTLTWRTPYLAFAIAPVVAGLALVLVLPQTTDRSRGGPSLQLFRELAGVFRVVGGLLSIAIIFQMLYAALTAFLALYLVDARGFDRPTAAVLVGAPYLAGMVGSPVGGWLSDRLGRKPVIVTTLICTGPLLLLLTIVPTLLIIPIMILMGFASSMRMPVIEGLLLDRAPVERRATTLGAYYLVAQELGGLFAPALGGIAQAIGIGQAFTVVGAVAAALSFGLLVIQHRL